MVSWGVEIVSSYVFFVENKNGLCFGLFKIYISETLKRSQI